MTQDPESSEELETWLVALVSELLGVDKRTIDVSTRLDRYGVDSAMAVELVDRLERRLGRELPLTLLYEHRTIRDVARHLTRDG